jgi:membrane protein
VVVLTGAVVTAMLPVFGRKPERHRVPGEELADALGVLGALARAHERGDVLTLNGLARTQRLSPDRCDEILVRAATRGWVARTERDGWILARDAAQIQVSEVYRAFVYDADAVGLPRDHLGLSLRDLVQRDRNEEKHAEAPLLSPTDV